MLDKRTIQDWLDGKGCLKNTGEGFVFEVSSPGIPKKEKPKFSKGDNILYDHVNGTEGRCVGEGIIDVVDIAPFDDCQHQYLVALKRNDYRTLMWFREDDLFLLEAGSPAEQMAGVP